MIVLKIIVQRVVSARVSIDDKIYSSINKGILAFLGITHNDTEQDIKYCIEKLINLRIFSDSEGKLNRSLLDTGGELMIVSNFTVYGDTRKGRRPSYTASANPENAEKLYNLFLEKLADYNVLFKSGKFREHMKISLENDGPVTLIINSKN